MKKILLILPVLLISLCALAAIDPQSEKQAEEFYREGKYNEAAEIYRKLRAGGMESAILYYNLGNCYYKLGENTQAILNYERPPVILSAFGRKTGRRRSCGTRIPARFLPDRPPLR